MGYQVILVSVICTKKVIETQRAFRGVYRWNWHASPSWQYPSKYLQHAYHCRISNLSYLPHQMNILHPHWQVWEPSFGDKVFLVHHQHSRQLLKSIWHILLRANDIQWSSWVCRPNLLLCVKVNTACIAKSERYSVKQLDVQTESSPVRGKP